jgi:hypothetical protein
MGFAMGRSVAVILALLVMISAAAAISSPASLNVSGATTGSLSVNITSHTNGQWFDSSTVVVEWEGNDTASGIWYYEVFLESLASPGRMVGEQTTITFNGLSEGSHTVIVRAHNNEGQTVEDSVVFFVDYSDPYLNIVSPSNNAALNVSDVHLVWQATDPSKITYYQVKLDMRAWITPIPPEVNEHIFEGVPEGYHTLTVIAYDGAGNSTSRSVSVLVDTIPPQVIILSPANGTGFAHADVDVIWTSSGTEADVKGFEVWSNGVKLATTTNATPFFHFTDLKDGYYTVTIRAFDQSYNTATDNVTFFVDTIEPSVVSWAPEGEQVDVSSPITVVFSKEMDHGATTISVSGLIGTVSWDDLNATFVSSTTLVYGTTYTVTATGKDIVGNNVSKSWTFTTTDMGTISGVVVDNNGNPLAGVSVSLDKGAAVVTNERGEFTFSAHSGQHNLTLSKNGWDGKTVAVTVLPGQTVGVGTLGVTPTNPLAIYGIIAAIAGVAIVAILIYFNHRRKKEKGPPARSWRGMEEMRKRANKGRKREDEDEEEELL